MPDRYASIDLGEMGCPVLLDGVLQVIEMKRDIVSTVGMVDNL